MDTNLNRRDIIRILTAAGFATALQLPAAEPGAPLFFTKDEFAMLDTLTRQLLDRDLDGAFGTARRYLRLGHEPRALFATVGLVASQADATLDQGHTLQIVQAAGEEFMAWPAELADTSADGILHVALRAAAFPQRNTLVPIPLPEY